MTTTSPAVAAAIEAGAPRSTARRWAAKGDPWLASFAREANS